jgi:ADP-heptose:LPS heptosyltransferase
MNRRKLILKCVLPPGAIVMLTAAVRDLHASCPDQFITDVRTSAPALWVNNPWLTPLREDDPEVEIIQCHYPLIHKSNQAPCHFIQGFAEYLGEVLGVKITPSVFRGDIHLSPLETEWLSQVQEITRVEVPFWIIAPGGEFDITIKWWSDNRYQELVDAFRGRILFVQVGDRRHHQPRLSGVLDLTGRTDLRQLVRLMYHSQGVLCPVHLMMHLSAAVPMGSGDYRRPCVVVAGGREPVQWEAYPHHQFLHTVGALKCCATGGCWRARTFPIGDGSPNDQPGRLCVDVVGTLPRCMDMIRAADVIQAIERYFEGGVVSYLTVEQSDVCERAIAASTPPRRMAVPPLLAREMRVQ